MSRYEVRAHHQDGTEATMSSHATQQAATRRALALEEQEEQLRILECDHRGHKRELVVFTVVELAGHDVLCSECGDVAANLPEDVIRERLESGETMRCTVCDVMGIISTRGDEDQPYLRSL